MAASAGTTPQEILTDFLLGSQLYDAMTLEAFEGLFAAKYK